MATIDYYKGFDSYVLYGEETSFGAGATPAAGNRIGKVTSFNINMTNNMLKTQGMGEGRNVTGSFTGAFDVTGSMDWEVDDFTFMQYAVGVLAGAGLVADPWQLNEADNIGYSATTIPTLTLEFGSEGNTVDHEVSVFGAVINNLTLTATQGETLKASCDFIGQTVASTATILTYTTPTTEVFVFQQGGVVIGASDTFDCTSFTLTIANNIQTYRNLGSRLIQQPVTGLRKYDFTITFKMKDDTTAGTLSGTELQDFFWGAVGAPATAATIASKAVSLDISEGAAATDRVVNIDLQDCYFESWSQPVALDGGVIEVTVTGYGHAGLLDGAVNVPLRWYSIA